MLSNSQSCIIDNNLYNAYQEWYTKILSTQRVNFSVKDLNKTDNIVSGIFGLAGIFYGCLIGFSEKNVLRGIISFFLMSFVLSLLKTQSLKIDNQYYLKQAHILDSVDKIIRSIGYALLFLLFIGLIFIFLRLIALTFISTSSHSIVIYMTSYLFILSLILIYQKIFISLLMGNYWLGIKNHYRLKTYLRHNSYLIMQTTINAGLLTFITKYLVELQHYRFDYIDSVIIFFICLVFIFLSTYYSSIYKNAALNLNKLLMSTYQINNQLINLLDRFTINEASIVEYIDELNLILGQDIYGRQIHHGVSLASPSFRLFILYYVENLIDKSNSFYHINNNYATIEKIQLARQSILNDVKDYCNIYTNNEEIKNKYNSSRQLFNKCNTSDLNIFLTIVNQNIVEYITSSQTKYLKD